MDPLTSTLVSQVLVHAFKAGVRGLESSATWAKRKGAEIDFLGQVGSAYAAAMERRYNVVKILGMDRPIALRDVYVRVNILDKIRSYERLSIRSLEKQFDLDKKGFGTSRGSWDGGEIVKSETYSVTPKVITALTGLLRAADEFGVKAENALTRLANKSYRGSEAMLRDLATECKSDVVRQQSAELLSLAIRPPQDYIILGKPGAGKSTFLKHLALQALDGGSEVDRIPVFVTLKDWADSGLDLLEYISRDFSYCGLPNHEDWIKALLDHGRCLVLLDGLDEVPAALQDRAIAETTELSTRYFKCQFVLSCRIAAYNHWFSKFADLEIADFDERQVRSFVKNWFTGEPAAAKNCIARINASRQTRELATTPLLLTLLCLAYDQTLGFPSNRAELYREGVDALLKKWDASRRIRRDDIYKNLSLRRRENMLSRIAAQTFEANQYFFPKQLITSYIGNFIRNLPDVAEENVAVDADVVLRAIEVQHGFLVERAHDIYSFSHLTFQEYFTAAHIVDGGVAVKKLLTLYEKDRRWREVILLTAGLLPQADGFFLDFDRWVRSFAKAARIDEALEVIGTVAKKTTRHAPCVARALLTMYWVHHAGVVRQSELTTCLQNFSDAVGILRSGKADRGDVNANLSDATQLARDTDFAATLAKEEQLWLRSALRGSTLRGAKDKIKGSFPEEEMHKFSDAVELMLSCLASDCYVSKDLRARLVDGAFAA